MGAKSGKYKLNEKEVNDIIDKTKQSTTKEELELQCEAFKKYYPDGKISKKAFSALLKEQFDRVPDKLTEHIFRIFDSDVDGAIDFSEFIIVLYVMSNGTPQENLEKIFRVFDINNDQAIGRKEMKKIVNILSKLVDENERRPDDENENVVDLKAKDAHKVVFAEMDDDNDGKIDLEEFKAAILSHKKFSQVLVLKIINIFVKTDYENVKQKEDLLAESKSDDTFELLEETEPLQTQFIDS